MAEPLSCVAGTLLPRTLLRTFPDGVPPEARDLQISALEALGNSKEVVEQARCMLGSSDATDHPQQRRRGLGRKRARFSMKPPTGKESANAGIKLDIDKLCDPEEYFSAVEKIEIADRELKKLKGQDSTDQLEHEQVAPVRKRRPGIRGKISSYRHSFGVDLDRPDGCLSAEEVCKRVAPEVSIDFESEDPRKDNSCNAPPKTETKNAFSNATEEDGSAIERESGARHLLNTLLSSFETLDDHDGAVFLQEKLQLKEINVDRMRLPVTPPSMKKTLNMKRGVQNFNKVALTQRSTAHNGSPLASISRLCKQSFLLDLANDPYSSSPSPTKDRSSRESSWKKSVDKVTHKLSLPRQVDTTVKNFDSAALSSVHDEAIVDLSGKENIDKLPRGNETVQSSPKMGSKFSDKLDDSPFTESILPENGDKNEKQDIIETSKCSRPCKETMANRLLREKETVEASPKMTSNFLDKLEVSPSTESIFSGTLDKNEKQDTADLSKASRHSTDFCGLDGSAKMRNIGNNMSENLVGQESILEYTEVLLHEDSTPVVVATPANGDSETSVVMQVENDELELPTSEELDPCMERPGNEKLKSTCGKDLGDSSAYDANNTEPCIDAGVCESEKEQLENDMALARNSHVSPEGNPKEKKAHRRRVNGKSLAKRKSLAEAGTKWEAGLRRSTRNRIRPLEFWRGERLLYGRIHDSLATVIGIKCSSPGNSTLKVKSYVSEDYADLLERASLH